MNYLIARTLGVIITTAVTSLAASADVITQSQGTADLQITFYEPIGQSFIAGDPLLSTIALAFSDINPTRPNDPIKLTLYQGGGFSGPVIRSITMTLPETLPGTLVAPQFIAFDFSGTLLSTGNVYTIAANTEGNSPKVAVVYSTGDAYAGGQLYSAAFGPSGCPACDLNFRVVATSVPEPNSVFLWASGLLVLLVGRRAFNY